MATQVEKSSLKRKSIKENGGAREGAGRKAFVPTENERKQVKALSGYGLPFPQIAALIRDGIHVDTLRNHFSDELIVGKATANAQVAGGIFKKAMAGDTVLMKYWAATQIGWRETQQVEHSGPGGAPIAMATMDLKGLNDTELAQMQALMMKAKGSEE